MFNTLLNQITAFFSKPFLIGAFLPTLFFLVINGAVLSWVYPPFRSWVAIFMEKDGWDQMGAFFRGILPVFAFSYVLWSLNPGLQSIMEGRILPKWLKDLLLTYHRARFGRIQEELAQWRQEHRQLRRDMERWPASLLIARQDVEKAKKNTYVASDALKALQEAHQDGKTIRWEELEAVYRDLEKALRNNNAESGSLGNDLALDKDHDDFLTLLSHTSGRAEAGYHECFAERDREFSPFEVRPTKLGNYSESVRGYAQSRYGMDTQVTWSRLLPVIKKEDPAFMEALLDQKGQLDFLVALLWLTALSTGMWLLVLPLLSLESEPVLAVGVTGPALGWVFHRVAMMNYRSFAELQRTAIDLFRLKLLERLELEVPTNLADERQTWRAVTQAQVFRESVNLSYRKGGQKS